MERNSYVEIDRQTMREHKLVDIQKSAKRLLGMDRNLIRPLDPIEIYYWLEDNDYDYQTAGGPTEMDNWNPKHIVVFQNLDDRRGTVGHITMKLHSRGVEGWGAEIEVTYYGPGVEEGYVKMYNRGWGLESMREITHAWREINQNWRATEYEADERAIDDMFIVSDSYEETGMEDLED